MNTKIPKSTAVGPVVPPMTMTIYRMRHTCILALPPVASPPVASPPAALVSEKSRG